MKINGEHKLEQITYTLAISGVMIPEGRPEGEPVWHPHTARVVFERETSQAVGTREVTTTAWRFDRASLSGSGTSTWLTFGTAPALEKWIARKSVELNGGWSERMR